jgi:hypothetical protein
MSEPGAARGRRRSGPPAGTFRARLEITNRSGWVTREYRLVLLPDRVRVAYAAARTYYDVRFDPQGREVVCSCPAFEADGHCKHRDAVLALLEGLAQRLGRIVQAQAPDMGSEEGLEW